MGETPNPKDPTTAHRWSVLDVAVRCHRRGDCHDIAYAYEDARYAALFREAGDAIDTLRAQLASVVKERDGYKIALANISEHKAQATPHHEIVPTEEARIALQALQPLAIRAGKKETQP